MHYFIKYNAWFFEISCLKLFIGLTTFLQLFYYRAGLLAIWLTYETVENNYFLFLRTNLIFLAKTRY